MNAAADLQGFQLDPNTRNRLDQTKQRLALAAAFTLDEAKEANFNQHALEVGPVRLLCDLAKRFGAVPLYCLPPRYFDQLYSFAQRIEVMVNTRKTIYSQTNPAEVGNAINGGRAEWINLWRETYPEMATIYAAHYAASGGPQVDVAEAKLEVNAFITTREKEYAELTSRVEALALQAQQSRSSLETEVAKAMDLQKRLKVAQESINATLAVKQVSDGESVFSMEREIYKNAAHKWLTAAVVLLVAVFVFIVDAIIRAAPIELAHLIPKAAALTILLGAAAWAARNHRRNKHNQIVCAGKSSSLLSIYNLYRAMDPKDNNRQAVLMRALDRALASEGTGYAAEPAGGDLPTITQIHEIVKKVD